MELLGDFIGWCLGHLAWVSMVLAFATFYAIRDARRGRSRSVEMIPAAVISPRKSGQQRIPLTDARLEAVAALQALGYSRTAAVSALTASGFSGDPDLGAMVVRALATRPPADEPR